MSDVDSNAAAIHGHAIADVSGLTTALTGAAPTVHTHSAGQVSGLATVATSGAKADIGLGAVNNTSDADKPVSTAQLVALNAKAALHHVHDDNGFLARSFDPANVSTGSITQNGVLYLVKLHIPSAISAPKLYWYVTNSGSSPTAGQNEVGFISAAGNRLGAAVNVDSVIGTAGLKVTSIPDAVLAAEAHVWATFVFNAATPPTLARGTAISSGSLTNAGLAAAAYRFATNGTGRTAVPSSITPSSNALLEFAMWAAVGL